MAVGGTLFVLGGLTGAYDDLEDEPAAAPGPATRTAVDAEPVPTSTTTSTSSPTATPKPKDPTPPSGEGQVPTRLVVSDEPGADVRAANDLEASLADHLVAGLEGTVWWPLVGELYVDEDAFISDVRVSLDVLAHPDALGLFRTVCDEFVAALPDTEAALVVHVYGTTVAGGHDEIDGSVSEWRLGRTLNGLARGDNFTGDACDGDGDVSDYDVAQVEAYLADQAG